MHWNLKTLMTKAALPVGLVVLGIAIGRTCPDSTVVEAQDRQAERRKAFKSGSERSEAVLREIATTLKQTDRRVANIETLLKKQQAKQ